MLLAAFTATAQNTARKAVRLSTPSSITAQCGTPSPAFKMSGISLVKGNATVRKSPKTAPSGDVKPYFCDQVEYVYGLTDQTENQSLFPRYHAQSDMITSADGYTYLPSPLCKSFFDEAPYIKGQFSADGKKFLVDSHQLIGTVDGIDLYFCNINPADGTESADPVELTVSPEGIMTTGDDTFYGIFLYQGVQSALYTFAASWQITPAGLFPTATSHAYNYEAYLGPTEQGGNVATNIEMVDMGEVCLIKNIIDGNNAWVLGAKDADNSITVYSYQVTNDNAWFARAEPLQTGENFNIGGSNVVFTYDAATETYKMPSGTGLGEFLFQEDQKGDLTLYIYTDIAINPSFSAKGTAGISNGAADVKEAVSTQYYDLSGRRVNGEQTGVTVKVMKYADGTSKAVKVVR